MIKVIRETRGEGPQFKDHYARNKGFLEVLFMMLHLTLSRTANFSHQSVHCKKCWGGKKTPAAHFPVFPQILNLHTENNLQAQASLGFSRFSLPPLFVLLILEGCSKQTGNVTQKCGDTFVSCFRKMSVSQSPLVELTHSIFGESFKQFWLIQSPLFLGPV